MGKATEFNDELITKVREIHAYLYNKGLDEKTSKARNKSNRSTMKKRGDKNKN